VAKAKNKLKLECLDAAGPSKTEKGGAEAPPFLRYKGTS
jgi:hypothetical protein